MVPVQARHLPLDGFVSGLFQQEPGPSQHRKCLRVWRKLTLLSSSTRMHADRSQMKESLNMHGSELTYAGNCFTAGYVLGQMPAVMLATRVRPSILIPTLEIMWSVLTFCTSSVTSTSQLYAIRFLVGLCESGYFPVMIVSFEHVYVGSEPY
jgi:ACS family pantothenate transporter-like MFS transporter